MHVSSLGGVTRWNDVGSGRAEICFRGKRANVLTRVEGSEGGGLFKSQSEKAVD